VKWYLPQLRFSPLKSSQVTLLVLWLVLSATSCQPSVALPVFSASTLHVPLSVAAIAFAPLIVSEAVSEPPFASLELLPLVNS